MNLIYFICLFIFFFLSFIHLFVRSFIYWLCSESTNPVDLDLDRFVK